MDKQTITLLIQIVVLIGSYLIGRYLIPNMPKETIQDITAKFDLIVNYADKFVEWAKYFKKNATGAEKMSAVVEQLKVIADRYNIDISEEEIKAITQKAYEQMMKGQQEAENNKVIAEAAKENAANTANIIIPQAPVVPTEGDNITLL